MKYFVFSLCVFVAVIWVTPSHAQATQFDITPKVCVVLQQHEFCDLELKVSWQTAQPQDVCLFQNNQQIQCWNDSNKGLYSHKARVQVETIYSLVNPHTGSKIATAKVEVQSTEAKTTRRRLRSPWSFF